jgi:hypothetical protein
MADSLEVILVQQTKTQTVKITAVNPVQEARTMVARVKTGGLKTPTPNILAKAMAIKGIMVLKANPMVPIKITAVKLPA